MLHPVHPAEELFALRAEIRALRARETELEDYFLEAAPHARCGPFHEARLEPLTERVVVPARLPAQLRADPSIYEKRITTRLSLRACDPQDVFTRVTPRRADHNAQHPSDPFDGWHSGPPQKTSASLDEFALFEPIDD